jgi:hypothetical protein
MVYPGGAVAPALRALLPCRHPAIAHLFHSIIPMSFLAIDIGNTRLKWALYAAPQPGAVLLEQGAVFLETIDELAERTGSDLPEPPACWAVWSPATRCAAASKQQMELWDMEPALGGASSAHEAGAGNGYDHPSRLGADRWVALIRAPESRVLATQHTAAGAGGDGRHGGHGGRARRATAASSAA